MGVIGQPLFIGWLIEELQENTSGMYCVLIGFARAVLTLVLGIASLFHLAMMYVERYTAIKHSLRYEIIVTEARLIGVSALLWTITLLSKFFTSSNYVNFGIGLTSLCIATIFVCQVVLCFETRRHEKEIASQQVSVEVREKFLKEKKASFETNNNRNFLHNNLLFANNNFPESYINFPHKFSKFSILCSFFRRLCRNFQFSA